MLHYGDVEATFDRDAVKALLVKGNYPSVMKRCKVLGHKVVRSHGEGGKTKA
jgi:hypothetical protein